IFGKWTSTRWNHQTACLTLVLLQLSLFGDLLGPWGHGAVLSSSLGDLDQHFIAWRLFAANQLRHGILPLWTPAYLGGTPFLGGFESALFYPFNLLFLLFSFPVAANLEIFFQVWMAGFFSYGWAASRGWRPGACLLVACGVSWSGPFFLQVYAGHLSNLCAMAWIPPVVWALEEVMKKTSRRWGIVLAAGVGLQGLAGHPQYSYYTAMMILIYALILGWGDRARFQKWAVAATAYGFGGLLAMAQWLPGLQAVLESSRGRLDDFKTAGLFSLPPENVLTLFLPGFFGPVGSAQYWGRWYLWDVCLFVGWSLLFLCGYGLFRNRWRSPRELLMIGIAFLLAIGQSTPLFRLLFDYLPGYRSFRGTCKFDIFIVLFIVLLAGSGFDALTREKRSGKGPVKFLGAVAVVASLLGITIKISAARGLAGIWGSWLTSIHWLRGPLSRVGRSTLDHFARSAGLQSAESLFLLAATAVVLAGAVVWVGRNPKGWVVLGFVAVAELFIFARAHRPTFD
ncbi:MAG: hypothetical protein ACREL1_02040, partial [bacterium]